MTYKSTSTYICDQCGKVAAAAASVTLALGWYELRQEQQEGDGDDLSLARELGDFCSLECLAQFVQGRLGRGPS